MHTIFRDSLPDAIGESKFVIVINVDVRGFSAFSKIVDSAQSALYIKKIFIKLITEYFNDASYYKSTGDGLIVIYDIDEKKLREVSEKVIKNAIEIVNNFSSLCLNEAMINFDVPKKCGIGISRGPATCLRSDDKILDYSGDTLNVASRLMDCARPEGIIFDKKFGIDLLPTELKDAFQYDEIYLKGVSERRPLGIFHLKGKTEINKALKRPVNNLIWEEQSMTLKLSEIKLLTGDFIIPITYKAYDPSNIKIIISHPTIKEGKLIKGYLTTFYFTHFLYEIEANAPEITINFTKLLDELSIIEGIKNTTKIVIKIIYQRA